MNTIAAESHSKWIADNRNFVAKLRVENSPQIRQSNSKVQILTDAIIQSRLFGPYRIVEYGASAEGPFQFVASKLNFGKELDDEIRNAAAVEGIVQISSGKVAAWGTDGKPQPKLQNFVNAIASKLEAAIPTNYNAADIRFLAVKIRTSYNQQLNLVTINNIPISQVRDSFRFDSGGEDSLLRIFPILLKPDAKFVNWSYTQNLLAKSEEVEIRDGVMFSLGDKNYRIRSISDRKPDPRELNDSEIPSVRTLIQLEGIYTPGMGALQKPIPHDQTKEFLSVDSNGNLKIETNGRQAYENMPRIAINPTGKSIEVRTNLNQKNLGTWRFYSVIPSLVTFKNIPLYPSN